jgi:hypothetical protein
MELLERPTRHLTSGRRRMLLGIIGSSCADLDYG